MATAVGIASSGFRRSEASIAVRGCGMIQVEVVDLVLRSVRSTWDCYYPCTAIGCLKLDVKKLLRLTMIDEGRVDRTGDALVHELLLVLHGCQELLVIELRLRVVVFCVLHGSGALLLLLI